MSEENRKDANEQQQEQSQAQDKDVTPAAEAPAGGQARAEKKAGASEDGGAGKGEAGEGAATGDEAEAGEKPASAAKKAPDPKAVAAAKAKAAAEAKAKAAAAGKAGAAKAAGAKAGAAAAKKPVKKEEAPPPPIPDRYKPMLDALDQEFAGVDFAPQYNPPDDYLYLTVPAEKIVEVGTFLRDNFGLNYLRNLAGVDWVKKLQVVYHLVHLNPDSGYDLRVGLMVDVDRDNPVIPSVVPVWITADWFEREALDMFGIRFEGHPNLRRILLPDHWQGGYPLRKDFVDKRPKKQRKVRPR